jgi:anti-sigma factor RsiW
MTCEEIEKSLIAYLDTKAQPSERRQVEAHLAECGACRERAEELRLLWSVLDELPAVSPSVAFDAGVRARVAREPRASGFWAWLMPSPRLALAGMALVALSLWLTSFPPAHPPAVTVAPQGSDAEFRMIKDLPVLEDYDVVANFDALSDLPAQPAAQVETAQP